MTNKLYPFDLPESIHPLAWVFLGFGLDTKRVNALAKHVFDDLGARVNFDVERTVEVCLAVDWPFDKEGYRPVAVGDAFDESCCSEGAVHIIEGHLPPGLTLEKHTGRIVGTVRETGLYRAVVQVGPRVKYDPLGGNGSPESPGVWIPINQPRMQPETVEVPKSLHDLDALELDRLEAEIQKAKRAKLVQEVEASEVDDGHSS